MTTLREAVARAIRRTRRYGAAIQADAAIAAVLEAMAEPSEGMRDAGGSVSLALAEGDDAEEAAIIWSAMLAAFRGEHLPAPPTTAKEPR